MLVWGRGKWAVSQKRKMIQMTYTYIFIFLVCSPNSPSCGRRRISGRRFSPPNSNVCESERQNDFRDVKPFVLILANQIKG